MAVLDILHFPDPRLRNKAKPVKRVNDRIRQLADDMLETMYLAKGIGLAAVQVNVLKRVVVIDLSPNATQPRVLINPVYTVVSDKIVGADEGCLSVPGFYEPVSRFERIQVEFLDRQGNQQVLEADGLLGACIQHECDHLDGILFVDHVSNLKRQFIRRKLVKRQRTRAE